MITFLHCFITNCEFIFAVTREKYSLYLFELAYTNGEHSPFLLIGQNKSIKFIALYSPPYSFCRPILLLLLFSFSLLFLRIRMLILIILICLSACFRLLIIRLLCLLNIFCNSPFWSTTYSFFIFFSPIFCTYHCYRSLVLFIILLLLASSSSSPPPCPCSVWQCQLLYWSHS
jgi:hypothetical protein